jgi:hypothetical protein
MLAAASCSTSKHKLHAKRGGGTCWLASGLLCTKQLLTAFTFGTCCFRCAKSAVRMHLSLTVEMHVTLLQCLCSDMAFVNV